MLRQSIRSFRAAPLVRGTRAYANSNAGRKGPLTGAEKKGNPNAGRKGPLTGKSRDQQQAAPEDSSSKNPEKQSRNAELSESTKGAEASADPGSAQGQGVENMGGHAIPEGPGKDGQFAEQGHSALDVAGTADKAGKKDSSREQKVDAKFWSDKETEESK
ncbi:protein of unknown function [Taphrina deformans PYCC 5710]|uniref:Uncharacterized protein n=1 Tax=Taphrina deformans (strain PYCC 5710 / ATCC 11124 / CBS 356.35 / IMI 108563 / JCM 9778 / NBRC 8474) TaxID=1097556 RepID=R4X9W3_TAPDE|nr:protein of unknown function [Taphrina deformans PYCC 5710]|eukprot:CCG82282.1 protein of unknown function [Taphrina deformans PYCC 5710]